MPFKYPSKKFTRAELESLNPNQNGVYGIHTSSEWIYVGRGDIRTRLLAHFDGDNPCITRKQPTAWTAEVTSNDVAREKELIIELNPSCNQKVG